MASTPIPTERALVAIAGQLGEALLARGWWVATAESSTGGLIGHAITSVAGASRYYAGGTISYTNRAKEVDLEVPHDLIAAHGAVSSEVAAAMAEGVRRHFRVELGIAVTGIAGPDGGSAEKPVGLHFVAAALDGRRVRVERRVFGLDRDGNRASAAHLALEMGLDAVAHPEAAG